jgi:flagellin
MQINLNTNTILHNLETNLNKIADPSKIDETNSADKTIDDSFRSDINSKKAELMNYNDAIGYMQIADGALQSVSQQTQILHKLDVATHNDALNSQQKSMLHHQMAEIQRGISDTLSNTTYNGINVFNNTFRVENDISVSLHVDSKRLDITDSDSILEFQKFVDKTRSDIGLSLIHI